MFSKGALRSGGRGGGGCSDEGIRSSSSPPQASTTSLAFKKLATHTKLPSMILNQVDPRQWMREEAKHKFVINAAGGSSSAGAGGGGANIGSGAGSAAGGSSSSSGAGAAGTNKKHLQDQLALRDLSRHSKKKVSGFARLWLGKSNAFPFSPAASAGRTVRISREEYDQHQGKSPGAGTASFGAGGGGAGATTTTSTGTTTSSGGAGPTPTTRGGWSAGFSFWRSRSRSGARDRRGAGKGSVDLSEEARAAKAKLSTNSLNTVTNEARRSGVVFRSSGISEDSWEEDGGETFEGGAGGGATKSSPKPKGRYHCEVAVSDDVPPARSSNLSTASSAGNHQGGRKVSETSNARDKNDLHRGGGGQHGAPAAGPPNNRPARASTLFGNFFGVDNSSIDCTASGGRGGGAGEASGNKKQNTNELQAAMLNLSNNVRRSVLCGGAEIQPPYVAGSTRLSALGGGPRTRGEKNSTSSSQECGSLDNFIDDADYYDGQDYEKPPEPGVLALLRRKSEQKILEMVMAHWFDPMVGFILLGNAFLMGYEHDLPHHERSTDVLKIINLLFTGFFFVEFLMRCTLECNYKAAHPKYVVSKWLHFDFVVVVFMWMTDVVIPWTNEEYYASSGESDASISGGGAAGGVFFAERSIGWEQLVNTTKPLRLIRIVRMFSMVEHLWTVTLTFLFSVKPLLWTVFFLFMVVFIFSMVVVGLKSAGRRSMVARQGEMLLVANYNMGQMNVNSATSTSPGSNARASNHDSDSRNSEVNSEPAYHRVLPTMLALFEIMTLDNWLATSINMTESTKSPVLMVCFFIVFLSAAALLMMNMITAVVFTSASRRAAEEQHPFIFKMIRLKSRFDTILQAFDDFGLSAPRRSSSSLEDEPSDLHSDGGNPNLHAAATLNDNGEEHLHEQQEPAIPQSFFWPLVKSSSPHFFQALGYLGILCEKDSLELLWPLLDPEETGFISKNFFLRICVLLEKVAADPISVALVQSADSLESKKYFLRCALLSGDATIFEVVDHSRAAPGQHLCGAGGSTLSRRPGGAAAGRGAFLMRGRSYRSTGTSRPGSASTSRPPRAIPMQQHQESTTKLSSPDRSNSCGACTSRQASRSYSTMELFQHDGAMAAGEDAVAPNKLFSTSTGNAGAGGLTNGVKPETIAETSREGDQTNSVADKSPNLVQQQLAEDAVNADVEDDALERCGANGNAAGRGTTIRMPRTLTEGSSATQASCATTLLHDADEVDFCGAESSGGKNKPGKKEVDAKTSKALVPPTMKEEELRGPSEDTSAMGDLFTRVGRMEAALAEILKELKSRP